MAEVNGLDPTCSDVCSWLWYCRPASSSLSLSLVCPLQSVSVSPPSDKMARVPSWGPVSASALPTTQCSVRSCGDRGPTTISLEKRLWPCLTSFAPGALQALECLFFRTTFLQMRKVRQRLSVYAPGSQAGTEVTAGNPALVTSKSGLFLFNLLLRS